MLYLARLGFHCLFVVGLALCWVGCAQQSEPMAMPEGGESIPLWNGASFSGWTFILEDENVNPHDVWMIRDGVIHCKGTPKGYMRTNEMHENYHLHLEWRWPEEPTNSGVLLHAHKPDQVWPKCIECQLKAGQAGDFVMIEHTGLTVDGKRFQDDDKQFVVAAKKEPSSESQPGQWNVYDIWCHGRTIRCVVNGVLQNEGVDASQSNGYICLQSEGSPIEFRNITITPLK